MGLFAGGEGLHGVLREVPDRSVPPPFEVARRDGKLPRDTTHQGRLAGPVPAEEPDPGARLEGQADAREHQVSAVSEARVLDEEQGVRNLLGVRKGEAVRGVDMSGGDKGEPLELLQSASRLPGLARLRPEAGDERLDLARPALLLLPGRPLGREAFGSLALERGVPATVRAGAAVLQVHDVGGGAVEEIAVVGDEEARPLAADEPLLKPHHRVEVEVVGRLVEEQQVRAAHQGLREVEPDPPPAREVRDGASEVFRVEPEAVEDPSRPRLRGVAVDGLELRVEGGEAPVVALALGRLDAALHRTERPVAVHRPVEGGRRTRLGLLGEVGDGPAPRDPDVALLGQEASPKEEEEARLADPVPPHDTGAMARVHDEVEPREQGRRASLEGDVREVDHRRSRVGAAHCNDRPERPRWERPARCRHEAVWSGAVAGAAYLLDDDPESALDAAPVVGVGDADALALVRPVVVLEPGEEVVAGDDDDPARLEPLVEIRVGDGQARHPQPQEERALRPVKAHVAAFEALAQQVGGAFGALAIVGPDDVAGEREHLAALPQVRWRGPGRGFPARGRRWR